MGGYWAIYGGASSLFRSPYAQIALVITVVASYFGVVVSKGSDIAISVIPNLLGFTIGAMAIVLSIASTSVFVHLAEDGEPRSFFMRLMSVLVNFVIVQVIALISGVIGKILSGSWFSNVLDHAAFGFVVYAITSALAVSIQLFLTAKALNASASLNKPHEGDPKE